MRNTKRSNNLDPQVKQILTTLTEYKNAHPNAKIEVRKQSPVSIRIRIIDPDFRSLNWIDREPEVWQVLAQLPDEIFSNITMLLLLTPEEAAYSLANQEFEHPIPAPVFSLKVPQTPALPPQSSP